MLGLCGLSNHSRLRSSDGFFLDELMIVPPRGLIDLILLLAYPNRALNQTASAHGSLPRSARLGADGRV
jgi:hypothetical protein